MSRLFHDFGKAVRRPGFFVPLCSIILIAVASGPFGTFDDIPLGQRATFMPTILLLWGIWLLLAEMFVQPRLAELHRVVRGAVLAAIVAVSFAPVAYAICQFGMARNDGPHGLVGATVVFFGLSAFYFFLNMAIGRQDEASRDSGLLEGRLGLPENTRFFAISADDHYVRVATDQGDFRVLLRFSDAIREVDANEGIQVHRSHWVARGAAGRLRQDAHKYHLDLVNGYEVPVSRGRLAETRDFLEAG